MTILEYLLTKNATTVARLLNQHNLRLVAYRRRLGKARVQGYDCVAKRPGRPVV